jgi:inorganic pyrophosphatase
LSNDTLKARVEIPKGSHNKYEYNEETGDMELDRRLFSAVSFPTDYGFIKETLTDEGEELDALVCVEDPTFPGCVVPVKPIAVFKIRDEDGLEHNVLCVPRQRAGLELPRGGRRSARQSEGRDLTLLLRLYRH